MFLIANKFLIRKTETGKILPVWRSSILQKCKILNILLLRERFLCHSTKEIYMKIFKLLDWKFLDKMFFTRALSD